MGVAGRHLQGGVPGRAGQVVGPGLDRLGLFPTARMAGVGHHRKQPAGGEQLQCLPQRRKGGGKVGGTPLVATGQVTEVKHHHPHLPTQLTGQLLHHGLVAGMVEGHPRRQSGLIKPLGEWVLQQAIADFQSWLAQGIDLGVLAVNLSPRQFTEAGLVQKIANILADKHFDAQRLELEITETALISRGDQAECDLHALKALGVSLAIDDFGTGYSSLAYLKRLPIDKLKIDRSFIKDLPDDVAGGEIVAAVIAMGKAMHLEVLAEGIETAEQQAFLKEKECTTGQGYWFSRPLPASELLKIYRTSNQPIPQFA